MQRADVPIRQKLGTGLTLEMLVNDAENPNSD